MTRRYGEPVDGGYPQIHVTVLSETGTHVIVEAFVKRGKKERDNEYDHCVVKRTIYDSQGEPLPDDSE